MIQNEDEKEVESESSGDEEENDDQNFMNSFIRPTSQLLNFENMSLFTQNENDTEMNQDNEKKEEDGKMTFDEIYGSSAISLLNIDNKNNNSSSSSSSRPIFKKRKSLADHRLIKFDKSFLPHQQQQSEQSDDEKEEEDED